jgi:hypothetical protein
MHLDDLSVTAMTNVHHFDRSKHHQPMNCCKMLSANAKAFAKQPKRQIMLRPALLL